jgi:hypothetical protein
MTLGALWGTARSLHCASSDPTVIWCNGGRGSEALAKKSLSRSNSFFQIFIFWGFRQDFDFSISCSMIHLRASSSFILGDTS